MLQARRIRGLLTVLVLALSVTHVSSQPRPPLKPGQGALVKKTSAVTQGSIAVNLVALPSGPPIAGSSTGQGSLALGKVSSVAGSRAAGVIVNRHQDSVTVSTSFGVRLDNNGGGLGSARLSAFLFHPDPCCEILLDGVKLSGSPRVIQTSVRYGAITSHRLEIEIPSSVPETQANIANNIGFMAIPN